MTDSDKVEEILSKVIDEANPLNKALGVILGQYSKSFSDKVYSDENNETDLLMELFGITPELKRENRQYWGRELGMCWQRMIVEVCRQKCKGFGGALRFDADEPCDLTVNELAIDTKYRIGSGDSGTIKKFKAYAPFLKEKGYKPIFLILRDDNLSSAFNACAKAGWDMYTGDDTYSFINELTGFDIKAYLVTKAMEYKILRKPS